MMLKMLLASGLFRDGYGGGTDCWSAAVISRMVPMMVHISPSATPTAWGDGHGSADAAVDAGDDDGDGTDEAPLLCWSQKVFLENIKANC